MSLVGSRSGLCAAPSCGGRPHSHRVSWRRRICCSCVPTFAQPLQLPHSVHARMCR